MDPENNLSPSPQTPQQPVMDIQRPMQPAQTQQFVPNPPESMPAPAPDAQEIGAPGYEQQHVSLNKQVKKKRRGLVLVIVLAVVVTLGLIGAAGYMYWQSQSEDATTTSTETTTETTTDDGTVDETDIDTTTADIDEALNSVDDSADFSSNDLSDDGIGL